MVLKIYAQEQRKSFIFNDRSIDMFNNILNKNIDFCNIVNSLRIFAKMNLFIIKNEFSTLNVNQLLPLESTLGNKDKHISLFGVSSIDENSFKNLKSVLDQINIVIESIIPEMILDIGEYEKKVNENGESKISVELMAIKKGVKVPLRYESVGIKKIVSLVSAMISMYNRRDICIVVDELDSGMFECILGEILDVLQESAKGQLIFTSHNLRVLEKLNKESIVFTTTNSENKYIKMRNVKNNNNLRDFYIRAMLLGGKKKSYTIKLVHIILIMHLIK